MLPSPRRTRVTAATLSPGIKVKQGTGSRNDLLHQGVATVCEAMRGGGTGAVGCATACDLPCPHHPPRACRVGSTLPAKPRAGAPSRFGVEVLETAVCGPRRAGWFIAAYDVW